MMCYIKQHISECIPAEAYDTSCQAKQCTERRFCGVA